MLAPPNRFVDSELPNIDLDGVEVSLTFSAAFSCSGALSTGFGASTVVGFSGSFLLSGFFSTVSGALAVSIFATSDS